MTGNSVAEIVLTGELLTPDEVRRLDELEQVVETGLTVFMKVGNALLEIRDSRLYRQQFPTFEAYCRERWGLSRPRAYQLLEAAAVVGNLNCLPMVDTISERQARPLTRLEPEVQREVWKEVLAETPHEEITAKVVEEKAKAAEPLNEVVKHEYPRPSCARSAHRAYFSSSVPNRKNSRSPYTDGPGQEINLSGGPDRRRQNSYRCPYHS